MEIRTLPLSRINRATYNPRRTLLPGDREFKKLKAAVTAFGLVEPLVWNERTENLVGGHQRLTVLEEQGATEAPVSVVDLSEADEKLLNIALNRQGGDWDLTSLESILRDLNMNPWELDVAGFDASEVAELVPTTWTLPEPVGLDTFVRNHSGLHLISLTVGQREIIERAVAKVRSTYEGDITEGEALEIICGAA